MHIFMMNFLFYFIYDDDVFLFFQTSCACEYISQIYCVHVMCRVLALDENDGVNIFQRL